MPAVRTRALCAGRLAWVLPAAWTLGLCARRLAGVLPVARARVAQASWAARPVRERAVFLRRYHDLVLDRADEILDVIQQESGKARRDALLDQIVRVLEHLIRFRRKSGDDVGAENNIRP